MDGRGRCGWKGVTRRFEDQNSGGDFARVGDGNGEVQVQSGSAASEDDDSGNLGASAGSISRRRHGNAVWSEDQASAIGGADEGTSGQTATTNDAGFAVDACSAITAQRRASRRSNAARERKGGKGSERKEEGTHVWRAER